MECWELNGVEVEPHHPVVLSSEEGAHRVIAIALPAGELLQEHQVHEEALLFVIAGQAEVSANGETRRLTAPALAQFRRAERHEVHAVSDCRLVLCLAPWPGPGHPSLAARAAGSAQG